MIMINTILIIPDKLIVVCCVSALFKIFFLDNLISNPAIPSMNHTNVPKFN
jgi:hypothetical protein